MNPVTLEPSARQQMTHRLDELAPALDGFPVRALVTGCLEPAAAPLSNQACGAEWVDCVLDHWIARLGHDLAQLPPSTLDVIRAISQRTHATREALIEVRRLFDRLARPRVPAVAPPLAGPSADLPA